MHGNCRIPKQDAPNIENPISLPKNSGLNLKSGIKEKTVLVPGQRKLVLPSQLVCLLNLVTPSEKIFTVIIIIYDNNRYLDKEMPREKILTPCQ